MPISGIAEMEANIIRGNIISPAHLDLTRPVSFQPTRVPKKPKAKTLPIAKLSSNKFTGEFPRAQVEFPRDQMLDRDRGNVRSQ